MSPRERARRRAAFAAVAPRLEAAHRGRLAELERERLERLRAADAVYRARRLVAHRELQLARGEHRELVDVRDLNRRRAGARYVGLREGKLEAGRRELAAALERARALGLDLS